MKTSSRLTKFDQVMMDFALACPHPTLADVEHWQAKYPEFADDFLESAADTAQLLMSGAFAAPRSSEPIDDATASVLLDQVMAPSRGTAPTETLKDLIARDGRSIGEIEAAMGFDGHIIQQAADGEIALPVPGALLRAFSKAVGVALDTAKSAFDLSAYGPVVVHMKAGSMARPRQKTYADHIRASDMPEDRKAFWLKDE